MDHTILKGRPNFEQKGCPKGDPDHSPKGEPLPLLVLKKRHKLVSTETNGLGLRYPWLRLAWCYFEFWCIFDQQLVPDIATTSGTVSNKYARPTERTAERGEASNRRQQWEKWEKCHISDLVASHSNALKWSRHVWTPPNERKSEY